METAGETCCKNRGGVMMGNWDLVLSKSVRVNTVQDRFQIHIGDTTWSRPELFAGDEWVEKTLIVVDGVPWQARITDVCGIKTPEYMRWARVPGSRGSASRVQKSHRKRIRGRRAGKSSRVRV